MVELGPHLFKTPAFWLGVVILAPVMALLLDFILSSWQRQRRPLDRQIFQVTSLAACASRCLAACVGSMCVLIYRPLFDFGYWLMLLIQGAA